MSRQRLYTARRQGICPLPALSRSAAQFIWICLTGSLLLPLELAGQQPTANVSNPVVETPAPVRVERSFPKLRFQRPVVFTNAGDNSNRIFVGSQFGAIHVFPNDQQVGKVKDFLDIRSRVVYKERENEEGLLGIAFHPNYEENGYFYVYYTTTDAPHTSVVSRFSVSASDPDRADPNSEVELLRIPQPFWNHNGGTILFGPDGYLYIGLGDGGSANDPHGNGQNLQTWLGSILRIDVDRQEGGKPYAVPRDNPFVGRAGARPEIYAYGFRNVWGMSFDEPTGRLWAADVGQDIWEEIDIVVRGGNYGWNLREGMHPFRNGSEARPDLIEPVFEYHHDVGKSITGGLVYRGQQAPWLQGKYLYGDYVSGKLWALEYDDGSVENYVIEAPTNPWITFGEDEQQEVYVADVFGQVFHFVPAE